MTESETPNPYQAPATVDHKAAVDIDVDVRALLKTGFGLKIVFYGILALMLMYLLAVISSQAVVIPSEWFSAAGTIGVLMTNIGPLFCLTIPSKYRLRPWVFASCACLLLGTAVAFAPNWLARFRQAEFFASLLWLVGATLFLSFMIRLARLIGRTDLANRGRFVYIVVLLLIIAGLGVSFFPAPANRTVGVVLFLSVTLVFILSVIGYLAVVNGLAVAIRRQALKSS